MSAPEESRGMTAPEGNRAPSAPALQASFSVQAGPFTVSADLAIDAGVLVLFGPSGSGKSLTLKALAGLLRPERGRIRVAGTTFFDSEARVEVPAHARRIGYVPQHHALFPFRDVAENIAFGLPRRERRRDNPKVLALLQELGIAHRAAERPAALSGGERQRVALARALAVSPSLLLLDEPFSSIDQDGREALWRVLREALDRHAIPAVFVTHDPDEALALGDKLVRFEPGRSGESGVPASLVRRGHSVRVTATLASPPTPLDGGRATAQLRDAVVEGPADILAPSGDEPLVLELRTRPRGRR